MKVLVTGGAGFIGSTIASALEERGITPVVLDSLVTGREEFAGGRIFYAGDIADGPLIDRVFADHPDIHSAIHCAALIVVPDSMANPLGYYDVNVAKTVGLVEHLRRNGCSRLVFASTAGMCRPRPDLSVDETSELDPRNPYTRGKMMAEMILRDAADAYGMRVISLRYLNPVGADPLLRTGQQRSKPSHALAKLIESYRCQETFTITGVDWPTRDGTAIRDYVHVWDIARAFCDTVARFDDIVTDFEVIHLGTGEGTTVRELIAAFTVVAGNGFQVAEGPARPGDVVGAYVSVGKAAELLGWKPEYTIEDAIRHSMEWSDRLSDLLA